MRHRAKVRVWALAIALLSSIKLAEAENAADVLNEFGLLGTWSANCAPGPTETEDRTIYKISSLGNPMVAHALHQPPQHLPEARNEGIYVVEEGEIKTAAKIDDDKISIVLAPIRRAMKENGVMVSGPSGPIVEYMIQKLGKYIWIIQSHTLDGKLVYAKDGFKYIGEVGREESQTLLREKCLN